MQAAPDDRSMIEILQGGIQIPRLMVLVAKGNGRGVRHALRPCRSGLICSPTDTHSLQTGLVTKSLMSQRSFLIFMNIPRIYMVHKSIFHVSTYPNSLWPIFFTAVLRLLFVHERILCVNSYSRTVKYFVPEKWVRP